MSGVQDIIMSRRSIYRFEESPVEMASLETAFEAARHAPCHKQTHPWKFYVLGKDARGSMIPEIERLAKEKATGRAEDEIQEGIQKVPLTRFPCLVEGPVAMFLEYFLNTYQPACCSSCIRTRVDMVEGRLEGLLLNTSLKASANASLCVALNTSLDA